MQPLPKYLLYNNQVFQDNHYPDYNNHYHRSRLLNPISTTIFYSPSRTTTTNRPYVDGYMITAQIISIVAFVISWLWWVTFIVGGICLVLLQVIWCCRQNKIGLYISAGISFVAAITCTIAGIIMIVVWKDKKECYIWHLDYDDDDDWRESEYYYREKPDYCEEGIWAVVAFVTALLWFATSGCILYFVKSGRHTKWEEKLQATADAETTAIEMGTVQHPHHNNHHQQEQEQQSPIAVATTSATTVATSYVLPDIPDNKIDDVQ